MLESPYSNLSNLEFIKTLEVREPFQKMKSWWVDRYNIYIEKALSLESCNNYSSHLALYSSGKLVFGIVLVHTNFLDNSICRL